jgi:hypothetical protein
MNNILHRPDKKLILKKLRYTTVVTRLNKKEKVPLSLQIKMMISLYFLIRKHSNSLHLKFKICLPIQTNRLE